MDISGKQMLVIGGAGLIGSDTVKIDPFPFRLVTFYLGFRLIIKTSETG